MYVILVTVCKVIIEHRTSQYNYRVRRSRADIQRLLCSTPIAATFRVFKGAHDKEESTEL